MRTTKELFDLTGRTALVTGGSRGLGLQIAESLGEMGAKVVLSSRKQEDLDEAVATLDPASPGFDGAVHALLSDLEQHIEREDLGIFPVAVVTLGRDGWETVEHAHTRTPSFLAPDAP